LCFETGSNYVSQVGLKLMIYAGITGVCHHTWL
jgi:hypothetical protein